MAVADLIESSKVLTFLIASIVKVSMTFDIFESFQTIFILMFNFDIFRYLQRSLRYLHTDRSHSSLEFHSTLLLLDQNIKANKETLSRKFAPRLVHIIKVRQFQNEFMKSSFLPKRRTKYCQDVCPV